jgi:hypothetical protein
MGRDGAEDIHKIESEDMNGNLLRIGLAGVFQRQNFSYHNREFFYEVGKHQPFTERGGLNM